MKTITYSRYGSPDVLQLEEVKKPEPKHNEVLIKIHVSTVTMGDCELRSLTLPLWTRIPMRVIMGYRRPRRFSPGMEFAGMIEAVGKNVDTFRKGDAVFGISMGTNMEYKCRSGKSAMAIKPDGLSFEEVVTLPVGGLNALHFLRKANIRPGQKVLIIGGGGSIGSYGVQLAKFYGAEVTAIDNSAKLDMLRSIGADHVIDYTKEDFSVNGVKYNTIFDTVYKSSFSKCVNSLTPDGCYLMANTGPRRMLWALWVRWTTRKRTVFTLAGDSAQDLAYLAGLMVSGKIKAIIDRKFSLEQIAAAHKYVEKGLKKGCVVVVHGNQVA
ncbi:MAG: NAD(P)-dependent alcohol dehydrogenase [Cyclobacteriaceae bacterium]